MARKPDWKREVDKQGNAKNQPFVREDSIVRRIWGSSDLILLIFAGSAAEFALNRAVDWLFFTGRIPQDPIGRLFSTARFAREIVFSDEIAAARTLERINAIHGAVERERGARIPAWAFRDVLYMLIDYSERAFALLHRPLRPREQADMYDVFYRVGWGLNIPDLPSDYAGYRVDRSIHLERDLIASPQTEQLYRNYRAHLGWWRYKLLCETQALIAPEPVRAQLRIVPNRALAAAARLYGGLDVFPVHDLTQWALLPPRYLAQARQLGRPPETLASATHSPLP